MILPVMFILAPVIASIITGISLNLVFPRASPGVYGWANLVIWYPVEAWYVVKKWQEAAKGSWLKLRYWIGKRFWENEFLIEDWTLLGVLEPGANGLVVTRDYGLIPRPDHDSAGNYIVEYKLRNKYFPRLIVAQTDLTERLLSFVGNISLVQHGGLLFENEHIAAASFVRCDFTKTDLIDFIPIGVFNDCALIAQQVHDSRKFIAERNVLEKAEVTFDGHYASVQFRRAQDSEAIRKVIEDQTDDIEHKVRDQTGEMVKRLNRAGRVPSFNSGGGRLGGPRSRLAIIAILILLLVLLVYGLAR